MKKKTNWKHCKFEKLTCFVKKLSAFNEVFFSVILQFLYSYINFKALEEQCDLQLDLIALETNREEDREWLNEDFDH